MQKNDGNNCITHFFRMNLHSVITWVSKISFLETGVIKLSGCKGTQTHTHFVQKQTLNYLAELAYKASG